MIDAIPLSEAVSFFCSCCSKQVIVCRSCWRNQKYCSKECSLLARLARHRSNQKKYSKTEAGQLSHQKRQISYRLRQKQ